MPYLSDIKADLTSLNKDSSSFLLIAPEVIRRQYLERELRQLLECEDTESKIFFGESLSAKDITTISQELFSGSLFASKQVIRLLNADQMKSAALDALLKAPLHEPASNILILHAAQLKSNSRLRKQFSKSKGTLELKPVAEKQLTAWTEKHAKALNIKASRDVCDLVVSVAEGKIDLIHQILEHLKIFCDEGKDPTKEDVLELFHYHPDPNEFQLLEKILTKPKKESERMVFELFEKGKNEFLLLNLLGRSISRLLHMQSLVRAGTPHGQLASALGMSPWIVKKDSQLLSKVPRQKLEKALQAIITADSQLKSKSLGSELIFSQLIHAI